MARRRAAGRARGHPGRLRERAQDADAAVLGRERRQAIAADEGRGGRMTILMQSTLELRGGDTTRFRETMKLVVETVEGEAGWRLLTAIEQITGRLHTAIDV